MGDLCLPLYYLGCFSEPASCLEGGSGGGGAAPQRCSKLFPQLPRKSCSSPHFTDQRGCAVGTETLVQEAIVGG